MRIGGEVALALPDADCETVWLEMTADERLLYGMHECDGGHGLSLNSTARFRAAAHVYDKDTVTGRSLALKEHPNNPFKTTFSLETPSSTGAFADASAAFLRTHNYVEVTQRQTQREKDLKLPPRIVHEYRLVKEVTKFARLLADLREV